MCLYPELIKNRKYIANKKNGGIIPAVFDNRALYVPVGCGKCMECKKKKSREWQIRLSEEIRTDKRGKFVTLTFSNESLKELSKGIHGLDGYELENEIAKKAVRRFLERWRKKYKKSVKHWLVTELGGNGTEHIHLHGLIFTDESKEEIEKIWQSGKDGGGFVMIKDKSNGGWVNEQTINYIVKYINKTDEKHKEYNSKILTSAGIGKGYIDRVDSKGNKYKEGKTKETYKNRQGYEIALPIYYRNHIYNEEEKEKLWIEKLNKNERWIGGEKIDADDEEKYNDLLKLYRDKNKRLGYGNNEINWDRKRYERERRNIIFKTRMEKEKEVKTKIIPSDKNKEEKLPLGNANDAFG